MIETEKFEKLEIKSREELRNWLLKNHEKTQSFWLVTYKKEHPNYYISRWDVLDELICFGWIDGIRRKLDEDRTMQLISQRKVEHWARTYKERAERLIVSGLMKEPGLQSVAAGKASGLWDFMDDVDDLIIPSDLETALKALSGASTFFNTINNSSKRFALRYIKIAKTEKTRKSRIEKIVQLAANGQKLPGS